MRKASFNLVQYDLNMEFIPNRHMQRMPFNELMLILNNPREINTDELDDMKWWMRPLYVVDKYPILEMMVLIDLVKSNSDARRLVESGAVKYNREIVKDCRFIPQPITNSSLYGIFKIGKNHKMVLFMV